MDKVIIQKVKRCKICNMGLLVIDYKNVSLIKKFITINGKIMNRHQSGLCAKHQRMVANAIKKARIMGLLPFVK